MQRTFSHEQRKAIYMAADGKCQRCGAPLPKDWHADHINPWSLGGATDVLNAQALCPKCNTIKGDSVMVWRRWQDRCFEDWKTKLPKDYLIAATPGCGKTDIALRMVKHLLDTGIVMRVVIVVPTDYLKTQWKDKAHVHGIELDPSLRDGLETTDFNGMAVTFQAVYAGSREMHRKGTRAPTVVVFDEVHHAGDGKEWGESIRYAFEHATHRICLSGTPFRTDTSQIPFVRYETLPNGERKSAADFYYGYSDALADHVLKTIDFIYIDATADWMFNGEEQSSRLSEIITDPGVESKRLRVATQVGANYVSDLVREFLQRADEKLEELRREVRKDSAGIIFVEDQDRARMFEQNREIHRILGEVPVVVYSEKETSKNLIDRFRIQDSKWIVSVKQISEGVDIPRLAVFVWATIETSELLFRQRIARVLRIEDRYPENIQAFGYIPADERLKRLARTVEEERDHVIESEEYDELPELRGPIDREAWEFVPGEVTDVAMGGVIRAGGVFEADPGEVARIVAQTKYSPEVVAVILAAQKQHGLNVGVVRRDLESAVADRIIKLKQHEDRMMRKLAGRRKSKDPSVSIGEISKNINVELARVSDGRYKDKCTIEDMENRAAAIKRWLAE